MNNTAFNNTDTTGPKSIAIIGGGPAGLIAAEILSAASNNVTIYDRMASFGRKFLLAGRGGLNLTHNEDFEPFLARYNEAAPALKEALNTFNPTKLREWCHALGQPTFVGSSGRVFPECFKTSPLLRAWLERLQNQGVVFKPRHTWLGWDDNNHLIFTNPDLDIIHVKPDATILALGGASWPRMGSDGGWVQILENSGIKVATLQPANCGFTVDWSEYFKAHFQGHPLKRIGLKIGETYIRGEALITEKGIEGGGIYAISSILREALNKSTPQTLYIDFKPDMDEASLAVKLANRKQGASLSTHLKKSASLMPVAIALLREAYPYGLPETPENLARAIKAVPIIIQTPFALDRAISTAGGVSLTGIDSDFMLVNKPGVFIAGEMLDWEAPTGGYLLQASFATGARAAQGILNYESNNN